MDPTLSLYIYIYIYGYEGEEEGGCWEREKMLFSFSFVRFSFRYT